MTYLLLGLLSIAVAESETSSTKEKEKVERKRGKKKKLEEAKGPVRFERTKIGAIDDFFSSAQSIENVLYTTSKNLNDAQKAIFVALDLEPGSDLEQVKAGIKNIGLKVRLEKDDSGKRTFTIESSLTPKKQAELQTALVALFVLCKDLVQEVPQVVDDVRTLNRAIDGIKDDFKAEIKVSMLTGEISPFQAVKAIGVLHRNIRKVPQMLITAILLTRELKETVNFLRFLFAGNDELMADLNTPKKDPVKAAAKVNTDCDCAEQATVVPAPQQKVAATQNKPTKGEPSANKGILSIKERNQDKFYNGFGGVSIGVQQYKNFVLDNMDETLFDGRETLNNEVIRGSVVSSYYYSRFRDSRVYIGYTISAMFSDSVFYSNNPRLLMNPYCSAYYLGVESVNGGPPAGDNNMFRATEGTYQWEGDTYYYSCQNHFGVRINRETLIHVPAEVNTAYVFRPTQKIMLWVAGGISVSWYDYRYNFNQSGYATHYDSYYQEEGQSVEDAMYDVYWTYSYEERFGASTTAEEEGFGSVKNSYLLGSQASIGAEYIFGELPRIGGEWGFGVLGKYSYIRGKKQEYIPYGSMDSEAVADSSKEAWWDETTNVIIPILSHWNVGGTLTWHY